MDKDEAMKMALEALEINLPIAYAKNGRGERFPCFSDDPLREIKTREAITALRQALEQPSDIESAVKKENEACAEIAFSMAYSEDEAEEIAKAIRERMK